MFTLKRMTFLLICILLFFSVLTLSYADTLFSDDFNSNSNNWPSSQADPDESFELKNGYYFFSRIAQTGTSRATQQIFVDQSQNYDIEAKIIKREGNDTSAFYGLTWTTSDYNTRLDFAINGFGAYSIYKVVAGVKTTFVDWSPSTFLKQGDGRANTLNIEKSGSAIEFFINDQSVHSMAAETFSGDNLGFFITGSQEIAIDYFTVIATPYVGCATAPGKVTLTSPSGTITDTTPTLTWNTTDCATWYRLFVWDSQEERVHVEWYEASDVCSGNSCGVTLDTLASDSYEFWVKSWSEYGKIWSDGQTFIVQGNEPDPVVPDPVVPDPVVPDPVVLPPAKVSESSPSGSIQDTSPTFVWSKANDATWYLLLAQDSSQQRVHKKFYDSTEICSGSSCSVTPDLDLDGGSYTFWVKSWNEGGFTWSDGKSFSLPIPSELDKEIDNYMDIVTSVGDLAPMMEDITTILGEVLNNESPVVTMQPPGVLDDPLAFLSSPQPVTITANFGNGYSPEGSSSVLTGQAVLSITNIAFSETSITANVNMTASNIRRDGVLVLDGGMSMSLSLVPGTNESLSLAVNVNFTTLQSLDFQINGGISISAPSMTAEGQLNQPVTITIQNLTTSDFQISGTATFTQVSSTVYDANLNLSTNEGTVTGNVRMDTTDPDKAIISTPSSPISVGDYTVDFNTVAFESEVCEGSPSSGNIVITENSETKTITFSASCDYAVN